jgi:hypothetical protein
MKTDTTAVFLFVAIFRSVSNKGSHPGLNASGETLPGTGFVVSSYDNILLFLLRSLDSLNLLNGLFVHHLTLCFTSSAPYV